jgi:TonB family protein
MRNHYGILGIRPDATRDEIKDAWNFSVKAFHPDKFAGSSQRQQAIAHERTKAINEAYSVLSDPIKRANYDREYAAKARAESAPPPPRTTPSPEPTTTASSAHTSARNNNAQETQTRKTDPPPEKNRNKPLPAVSGVGLYISWLIAAAMLVSAAVEKHPYSFYMLLRWICCAIFAWSAFIAHAKDRPFWAWGFGALAVLYNPIVLVHLSRSTWINVNWFTVGVIIVAAIAFLPRRAQIWAAATAALVVIIAGLLWVVPRTQKSISNASPRETEPSPPPTALAQSSLQTPLYEKELSPPITGETTWQWLQRNNVHGLPGNHNLEMEPSEPLATLHPFANPKPRDALYDAEKESDLGKERTDGGSLVRFYRRGVFAGYNVIKKVTNSENFVKPPLSPNKYVSNDPNFGLTPIPRAIPRALPVAPRTDTPSPLDDTQLGNVSDQFDVAGTATTPVAASSGSEPHASDSTPEQIARKPKLVYAPRPSYPLKANKMRITGSGRFKITFDERGNARSVEIVQSTGNRTLDSNTVNTLKLWRAAPGNASDVVVPIEFRQQPKSPPRPKANASQRYQSPINPPPDVQAPQINPYIPR